MTFLYTFLEDFKKHGTNAAPYFVLTLFDELLFQKGTLNFVVPA